MEREQFEFAAELWIWRRDGTTTQDGVIEAQKGNWYFVWLPREVADWIAFFAPHGGWGSVRVEVSVGQTMWRTSVFRDKKNSTYILPVKKAVRQAENWRLGESVRVRLCTC